MAEFARKSLLIVTGLLSAALMAPALAHVGHAPHVHASGFHAGFMHPWLGLDHLLAMVAVGLLAVRARSTRALFLIPAGFVGGMLIGAALFYGVPPMAELMPVVEMAIVASVVLLGLAVALLPRVALVPTIALVALAGLFHGGAHIVEMTGAVATYALGMTVATALLHALGIGAGLALVRMHGEMLERAAGGALACTFVVTMLL